MRNHALGGLAFVMATAVAPTAAEAFAVTVNCPGQSIAAALAGGADEITVIGTCTENVNITQDDVTIQGGGGGGTVAGELRVTAARRVTIQNLSIQGSGTPGLNGIVSIESAAVRIANVTIDGVGDHGVIVLHGASADLNQVTVRNSTRGIVAEDNGSFQVVNSLVENSSEIAIVINRQSSGVVIDSTVQNNDGIGILFALGGGGNVINTTIKDNGGNGIFATNAASAVIDGATITGNEENGIVIEQRANAEINNATLRNNKGPFGILFDKGGGGIVTNSTIEDNGGDDGEGIHLAYSSTALVDSTTIRAKAEGVGLDFAASVFLSNNTIMTTTSDDATLDLSQGSVARLAGGNRLTASPNGFSIFLQQGSTLMQRSALDTAIGPVLIRSASNAELRKVHITGNVAVEDHSLLRFRDLAGVSNVSVIGNISIAQDSGLNFIRNVGDRRVTIMGNITCADTESSISAPISNVTVTGKIKDCTGYNNVSN